jgi:hypothetical protein
MRQSPHEPRNQPFCIDANRLGDGPQGRAAVWWEGVSVCSVGDAAGVGRVEGTDMGTDNLLLHWPPREHPDWAGQSIDALDGWWIENRMGELDRDIDRLTSEAWDCEGDLNFAEAERLVNEAAVKQAEYDELKQQLGELIEGGVW